MNLADLLRKAPIPHLVEMIGEEHLKRVEHVLEILSVPGAESSAVYTKSFLSNYASRALVSHLASTPGELSRVVDYLSAEDISQLFELLGRGHPYASTEDKLQTIRQVASSRGGRRDLLAALGCSQYVATDGQDQEEQDELLLPAARSVYRSLKDYQFEVFFQSLEKIEHPYNRFILQMPTGSGKTRTAMELVCAHLNSSDDSSVIWLAHSTELCDQAFQCFLDLWPHIGTRELRAQRHYGPHKLDPYEPAKIGFLCIGFQAAYASLANVHAPIQNRLGARRLIIVDEAHKVIAPTYKDVTKALMSDGCVVVGLTATPGRTFGAPKGEDQNAELAEFFFNTIISFNPHGKSAIQYLRSKRVLARARFEPLRIAGDNVLSAGELAHVSKLFELPSGFLSKLGKSDLRNSEIVHKLIELVEGGTVKSIIYFGTSVEQSVLVSSIMRFLGVNAEHVDGSTPRAARDALIEDFRQQRLTVLCNYEVLSTGFDAPKVDCVFIARPTASVVLYSQMIGRGLRGPVIGGTESCLIVNVLDNLRQLPSVERMYEVFEDYWRDDVAGEGTTL